MSISIRVRVLILTCLFLLPLEAILSPRGQRDKRQEETEYLDQEDTEYQEEENSNNNQQGGEQMEERFYADSTGEEAEDVNMMMETPQSGHVTRDPLFHAVLCTYLAGLMVFL
ncbi:hypothetical protein FKM82_014773 [Ascaphus truei]